MQRNPSSLRVVVASSTENVVEAIKTRVSDGKEVDEVMWEFATLRKKPAAPTVA